MFNWKNIFKRLPELEPQAETEYQRIINLVKETEILKKKVQSSNVVITFLLVLTLIHVIFHILDYI